MPTAYSGDAKLNKKSSKDDVEIDIVSEVPAVKRSIRASRYDKAFDAALKQATEGTDKPVRLRFKTHRDAQTRVQHIRQLADRRGELLSQANGQEIEFTVIQRLQDLFIKATID